MVVGHSSDDDPAAVLSPPPIPPPHHHIFTRVRTGEPRFRSSSLQPRMNILLERIQLDEIAEVGMNCGEKMGVSDNTN